MRLFTLLVSVFTITSTAFSQHYQTVYAGQNVNFTTGIYAEPLYMDSIVNLPTADIFIPTKYKEDAYNQSWCVGTPDTTWIGDKVILQHNGKEVYFNELGDSIFLYPQREVGESWAMTTLKDGYFIEATITQKQLITFIGLTDSVKIITIQAKDSIGNPIVHILNQKTLQISKHYGWVKGIDFRKIPNTITLDTMSHRIQGINDNQIGVYNIGFDEIFDFEVGDIFHDKEYSYFWPSMIPNITIYTKRQILQKTVTSDSVSYLVKRGRLQLNFTTVNLVVTDTIIQQSSDTIQEVYTRSKYQYLDNLPLHFGIDSSEVTKMAKFSNLYHDDNYQQLAKMMHLPAFPYSTNCWIYLMEDCSEGIYYNGLGGPYWFCDSDGTNLVKVKELLHYQKYPMVWGNPINFDSITSTQRIVSSPVVFQLYPNPTSSTLNLKILQNYPENASVSIRNTLGQQVMVIHNPKQTEIIDVSELSNGVYFVSLESKGAVYTEELVIQK